MQARRATALVVTCVLSLCLVTAAHLGHSSRHTTRAVAVLTASTADAPHYIRHISTDATGTFADLPVPAQFVTRTSDTSQDVSTSTAHAPLIRGPPGQGRF